MDNLLNFWGFHIYRKNQVHVFFQGPLAKWVNHVFFWVVATQTFFIFTPTWGNDPI